MQSLHSKAQDELPLSSAGARDMFESQRALELRKCVLCIMLTMRRLPREQRDLTSSFSL